MSHLACPRCAWRRCKPCTCPGMRGVLRLALPTDGSAIYRHFKRDTTLTCAAALALTTATHATDMNKTVRVAFQVDVTGFDPAATSDLYSAHINNAIFGNFNSTSNRIHDRRSPADSTPRFKMNSGRVSAGGARQKQLESAGFSFRVDESQDDVISISKKFDDGWRLLGKG